jgi:hypothetical protein
MPLENYQSTKLNEDVKKKIPKFSIELANQKNEKEDKILLKVDNAQWQTLWHDAIQSSAEEARLAKTV